MAAQLLFGPAFGDPRPTSTQGGAVDWVPGLFAVVVGFKFSSVISHLILIDLRATPLPCPAIFPAAALGERG